MPKLNRNALSAQMVRHAGPGSYVDGNGLMLRVRDSGSRSWVQRIMVHGRRIDIGLGNAELVSLADARRIAADNRAVARTGGDPRRARTISFADAEPRAMAEKAETWRRGAASKSARDWRSSMDAYVLPAMGTMHVGAVATGDVKRVLRPLALAGKHATVRLVAGRIVAVLEWAEVENLREPAGSGRAIVETVMRSLPKAAAVRHHPALHFADVADAQGRQGGRPPAHRPRSAAGAPVRGADGRAAGSSARRRWRMHCGRRRSMAPATASGPVSRTGRATRAWTNCSPSSRWRTWRGRRRWPPTRATISSRSGGASCRRGATTSAARRGTDGRACRCRDDGRGWAARVPGCRWRGTILGGRRVAPGCGAVTRRPWDGELGRDSSTPLDFPQSVSGPARSRQRTVRGRGTVYCVSRPQRESKNTA